MGEEINLSSSPATDAPNAIRRSLPLLKRFHFILDCMHAVDILPLLATCGI